MASKTDPLPCPFCGSKTIQKEYDDEAGEAHVYFVECSKPTCHAAGPSGKNERESILKWNFRIIPQ